MDFELSEEQEALRDTARDFLKQRWPSERMRQALDTPPVVVQGSTWKEIAELGWAGLCVAGDLGGSEADAVTAAVLAEEAGRGLLAGPLLGTIAAGRAIERSGNDDLRRGVLPGLCGGSAVVTLATEEPGGVWGADTLDTRAEPSPHGWVLSGTKILVADTDAATMFLVAAGTPEGPRLLAVPADAATITPMRRLDGQSIGEVVLEGVDVPAAAVCGDSGTLAETRDFMALLGAADLLGTAHAVLDMSVQYAKDRVQFGRPIGTFQAVAHRLADAHVDCEIARSLVYAAALAVDEARPEAPALVSAAKAWAGDTAVTAAETAVAVHGGIGFTWELDVHLYLRRARAGAVTCGEGDRHRDRVASIVRDFDGYRPEGASR